MAMANISILITNRKAQILGFWISNALDVKLFSLNKDDVEVECSIHGSSRNRPKSMIMIIASHFCAIVTFKFEHLIKESNYTQALSEFQDLRRGRRR